jgi:hypothetical protein
MMPDHNTDLPSDSATKTCFVMMPFGPQFNRYYRNIFVPAIGHSGLTPVRGDSIFGPSDILKDIWQLLKQSTIALADLTGRNPNVFYELGLAHAIGKAVILVTSNRDDVPFDLQGLRVIVYDKNDEDWGVGLQSAIEGTIAKILGDPTRAVPATFADRGLQACLLGGDPLQIELRRLAEEVRAIRLGGVKLAGANLRGESDVQEAASESVLATIFPQARGVGLSWGQARHLVDLVLASKERDALSYMEAAGVARPEAERVLTFLKENC